MTDVIEKVYSEETSRQWSPDRDINLVFLRAIFSHLADRLKSRGHLFLNEVYDEIGLSRTRDGQLLGWTYSSSEPTKRYWEFDSSSEEDVVHLKFFPEGEIIDKIEET